MIYPAILLNIIMTGCLTYGDEHHLFGKDTVIYVVASVPIIICIGVTVQTIILLIVPIIGEAALVRGIKARIN